MRFFILPFEFFDLLKTPSLRETPGPGGDYSAACGLLESRSRISAAAVGMCVPGP